MFLPPGDERLLEPRAQRLACKKPKPAWARLEREEPFGTRRPQPLEIHRERPRREGVARCARLRLQAGLERRADLDRRDLAALREIKPTVLLPDALLDGRLAAHRGAPQSRQWPRAQVRVIDLTVRRLDDLSVPGALQRRVGRVLRRYEMDVRVEFVRAFDPPRARHRHGVVVAGAALGDGEVIPAVALEEMRPLGEPMRTACEDALRRPDQSALMRVPLLQANAEEGKMLEMRSRPIAMVPDHVEEPLAAVVVMKEGWVEPARIDVNRVRPAVLDGPRRHDVIVRVLEVAIEPFDVGVDEPEAPIGEGEARRPDAAGIGLATQVELRGALERPPHKPPVHKVARVMDLDPRTPFEGGGGDVVVVADAADRRIGIEAGQDRIADDGHRAAQMRPRSRIVRISGTWNSLVTWPSEL